MMDELEEQVKELALAGVGAASVLKDRAERLTKELAKRGEQVLGAKAVENTPLHRKTPIENNPAGEDSSANQAADSAADKTTAAAASPDNGNTAAEKGGAATS